MNGILAILIGYLLGSVSPSYLIARAKTGRDLRFEGSGNLGGRNVWRTAGFGWSLLAFLLDVFKGAVSAWLGGALAGPGLGPFLGFLGVVSGHNYSVFLGFSGGKGLAAAIGSLAVISLAALGCLLSVGVLAFILFRSLYLAAVAMSLCFPLVVYLQGHGTWVVVTSIAVSGVVTSRHLGNLRDAVREWKK
jgi:glycerol-3-phosphate acyltransferase PlsY